MCNKCSPLVIYTITRGLVTELWMILCHSLSTCTSCKHCVSSESWHKSQLNITHLRSSGQISLPRYLMNTLNNFDKPDREYSLSPTDDLIRFWRSNVKATAGCRGGKCIHVDTVASNRCPSSNLWIICIVLRLLVVSILLSSKFSHISVAHCWINVLYYCVFREVKMSPRYLCVPAGLSCLINMICVRHWKSLMPR